MSSDADSSQHIFVCLRIRPHNRRELDHFAAATAASALSPLRISPSSSFALESGSPSLSLSAALAAMSPIPAASASQPHGVALADSHQSSSGGDLQAGHRLSISSAASGSSGALPLSLQQSSQAASQQPQQQAARAMPPSICCVEQSKHTVHLLDPMRDYSVADAFTFDRVFWSLPAAQTVPPPNAAAEALFDPPKAPATQEDVFAEVGLTMVRGTLDGRNTCLMAYGQTGAGKSHSVLGTPEDPGVAPRFVKALFREIAARQQHSHAPASPPSSTASAPATATATATATADADGATAAEESGGAEVAAAAAATQQAAAAPSSSTSPSLIDQCEVKVELGFLEIYNEKVRDLLLVASQTGGSSTTASRQQKVTDDSYSSCRVRHHPERGTFVEGLQRKTLASADECLAAIEAGMTQRSVAATAMNDTSSRSHGIFQLVVTQRFPHQGITRTSLVNIVDLAGSERVKQSNVTGQALIEATMINKSLSTLRRVIDVLIDNAAKKSKQIPPYRESLLTWVLSDSLGGNSRTVMIAAVSPNALCYEDTKSTLLYALKAKSVVNSSRVNEERSNAVMSSLRAEMQQLREQLDATKLSSVERELAERQAQLAELEARSRRYEEHMATTDREMQRRQAEIAAAEAKLRELNEAAAHSQATTSTTTTTTTEKVFDAEEIRREKERVEQEVETMRRKQEEDEAMLRREAAQRERAEAELSAALEQRRRIEMASARGERELSAAAKEEEQMRVRQLLATLQAAFVRFIAGQNLAQLRTEREALRAQLATQRQRNDEASHRHHDLQVHRARSGAALEFLQKKVDRVQHHELLSTSSNALRDRRAQQLRRQQQALTDEAAAALSALDAARAALAAVQCERQRKHSEFLVEKARLETEIAELDRQAAHAQDRIDGHLALVQEHQESEADWRAREKALVEDLSKLGDNNAHRARNICALREALAREGPACARLMGRVQGKEAEYAALGERLREAIAAVEEARQRSAELRGQMDEVFLPPTPRTTQAFFRTGTASSSRPGTPRAGDAAAALHQASAAVPFSRTTTRGASSVHSTASGQQQNRLKRQATHDDLRGGGIHYSPPIAARKVSTTPRRAATPTATATSSSTAAATAGIPSLTLSRTGHHSSLLQARAQPTAAAQHLGVTAHQQDSSMLSPMSLSRNDTSASGVSAASSSDRNRTLRPGERRQADDLEGGEDGDRAKRISIPNLQLSLRLPFARSEQQQQQQPDDGVVGVDTSQQSITPGSSTVSGGQSDACVTPGRNRAQQPFAVGSPVSPSPNSGAGRERYVGATPSGRREPSSSVQPNRASRAAVASATPGKQDQLRAAVRPRLAGQNKVAFR